MSRWRFGALALLTALSFARSVSAREPVTRAPPSLLNELGTPAAERLLSGETSGERLRAFARLSALGNARALDLLARALEPGGAARGAEEHLAAVRALAPHAKLPVARDALVRALSSPPVESGAAPLSDWVRSAAALALAHSGEPAAHSALGRALRKPGHAGELAKQAFVDSPPQDLTPLLHAPGAPTATLCEALAELGDLRAEGFLREVVQRGAPEARAAAALALQSLGSTEVVELARHWLQKERQPALLRSAAEILSRAGHADAMPAASRLMEVDPTGEQALALLLSTDGRVPAPPGLTVELAGDRAPALLELFARGLPWGGSRLERALASPETAGLALYALARAPGARSRERLNAALGDERLRASALRALSLRSVRLNERAPRALRLIGELWGSGRAEERASAALARGLLEPETLPEILASTDSVVVRAVARLALSGDAARAAALRLSREQDPVLKVALSASLLEPTAADLIPTPTLLELTQGAGPAALLAAAALSARKDAELSPLIRELLSSPDPWLRAHALLGLSRARSPDALGLIEGAYRFEPDESVRHAAVVALSRRPEPVRARTLRLAADLDAASTVREAARLALTGQSLGDGALGLDSIWLELLPTAGLEPGMVPAAQVRIGWGLALPLVADPDGVVAVGGVDSAGLSVRLALLDERVKLAGASR
jgi:cellulose synthase operon protein C